MDLTKGNITKCLLLFSLPIIISYLFQQVYAITDAAIIGQNLSSSEIAGVSDVGCLTYIVMDFAFGCAGGFSALSAKAIGEKNLDHFRKSFAIQIVLTAIIGIIITFLALIFTKPLLSVIKLSPENPVYQYAYEYISIFFLGTLAQIFYNQIQSILRSYGDSVTPLIFLIFSTIMNISLDLLFIVVFKWGVAGAALATIISQLICAIGCFVYAFLKYPELRLHRKDFLIDWKYAFEHLKNGLPLGFQFSILAFGIIIMQAQVVNFDIQSGNPLNPAQLGYGATNKYIGLIMTPFNAFGAAFLSFVGQNNGAKNFQRIKEGLKKSYLIVFIAFIIVGGLCLLSCINGAYLYIFLNPSTITSDTIVYGTYYFFINIPLIYFLGLLFLWRNALQGLERPFFPFIAGVVELIARIVISLYFPSLVSPLDPTSNLAYFALMSSDVGAWILADVPLLIGMLKYFYCNKKLWTPKKESY